jgi:hypothetical protein
MPPQPRKIEAILVASHPRSGTHLVLDTIRRQIPATAGWRLPGLPLDHLYLNLERLGADWRRFEPALAWRILRRVKRPLMKTHFRADFSDSWSAGESVVPAAEFQEVVNAARVIYVVRHPLAVMSSYMQFLSAIHPDVRGMSLDDFIFSPHWTGQTDRLGWWCAHVQGWRARPDTLLLRYEDLVASPRPSVEKIAAHIGETPRLREPYLPPKITSLAQTRLNRLTRLSPPSTAIVGNSARFPLVDWRKTLKPETREAVRARCGALLETFGYEVPGIDSVVGE